MQQRVCLSGQRVFFCMCIFLYVYVCVCVDACQQGHGVWCTTRSAIVGQRQRMSSGRRVSVQQILARAGCGLASQRLPTHVWVLGARGHAVLPPPCRRALRCSALPPPWTTSKPECAHADADVWMRRSSVWHEQTMEDSMRTGSLPPQTDAEIRAMDAGRPAGERAAGRHPKALAGGMHACKSFRQAACMHAAQALHTRHACNCAQRRHHTHTQACCGQTACEGPTPMSGRTQLMLLVQGFL